MTEVKREHKAGLELALAELKSHVHCYGKFGDVLYLVSELIAQASAAPEEPCGITEEHLARIDLNFALSGADIESLARLEASAAPEQEPSPSWIDGGAEAVAMAKEDEIERLRDECAGYDAAYKERWQKAKDLQDEIDALAQRLDQAQSLLSRCESDSQLWYEEFGEPSDGGYQAAFVEVDAFLSATAQPVECQHRYMYFGTQPARRCADCNKVEPAEVKS